MGLSTSKSVITKKDKLMRLAASMAGRIAKQKNDPLLMRLRKAQEIVKMCKIAIVRKYGRAGLIAAKQAVGMMRAKQMAPKPAPTAGIKK